MPKVNDYPLKPTAGLDDYVPIGRKDKTCKATVDTIISNLQDGILKSNMGIANAGKVLTINDDGKVILTNPND